MSDNTLLLAEFLVEIDRMHDERVRRERERWEQATDAERIEMIAEAIVRDTT